MIRGSVAIVNHSFCDGSFMSHFYVMKPIDDRSWEGQKACCTRYWKSSICILIRSHVRNSFVSTVVGLESAHYKNYTHLVEGSASTNFSIVAARLIAIRVNDGSAVSTKASGRVSNGVGTFHLYAREASEGGGWRSIGMRFCFALLVLLLSRPRHARWWS